MLFIHHSELLQSTLLRSGAFDGTLSSPCSCPVTRAVDLTRRPRQIVEMSSDLLVFIEFEKKIEHVFLSIGFAPRPPARAQTRDVARARVRAESPGPGGASERSPRMCASVACGMCMCMCGAGEGPCNPRSEWARVVALGLGLGMGGARRRSSTVGGGGARCSYVCNRQWYAGWEW